MDSIQITGSAGDSAQVFEIAIKIIGSIIAIVGAYLAVLKYLEERRKANETAKIESQKPFFAKKQEIFLDLLTTTSVIANEPDRQNAERKIAERRFWAKRSMITLSFSLILPMSPSPF